MSGAVPTPEREAVRDLRARAATINGVKSVRVLPTEHSLSVWVGITEESTRNAVYALEDELSERFPDTLFDFHVFPVPEGKTMEDYISAGQIVYQQNP